MADAAKVQRAAEFIGVEAEQLIQKGLLDEGELAMVFWSLAVLYARRGMVPADVVEALRTTADMIEGESGDAGKAAQVG